MPQTAPLPAFTIRPVRADDLPAIIEVDTRITAAPKPEYWHGKVTKFGPGGKEGFFLVASRDEAVLGFIVGEIRAWEFGSPLCGWVSAIGVSPDSRLDGIGSALFDSLCARFREAGVSRIRTMLAREAQLVMSFFRSQGMMAGPFIQLEKELDD